MNKIFFFEFLLVISITFNFNKSFAAQQGEPKSVSEQNNETKCFFHLGKQGLSNKGKNCTELNIGLEFSNLNYNMLTAAGSVLRWRDSRGTGMRLEVSKDIGDKYKIGFRFLNSKLKGGNMTDDDIQNLYGTFSQSNQMSGNYNKIQALIFKKIDRFTNSKSKSFVIFGLEQKKLNLHPKDGHQLTLGYNDIPANIYYLDKNTQTTKMLAKGLNIGLNYELELSNINTIGLEIVAFLPLLIESSQHDWGYNNTNGFDWQMRLSGLKALKKSRSYAIKIEEKHKINDNYSLSLYVFSEVMKVNNAYEIDRKKDKVMGIYQSQNIEFFNFGIGTSLSIK
jgi:hypothetical protein